MTGSSSRRQVLGAASAALVVSACGRAAESREAAAPIPRARPGTTLKAVAPFPVGTAVGGDILAVPAYRALIARHFDQITPENGMKMWMVLKDDGSLDFTDADTIVSFATENGLRIFGHTLIYYTDEKPTFVKLKDDKAAFERAYRSYIGAVAGRYAGRVVAWDVVNEAVQEDDTGLRGGVFQEVLGVDYIPIAFEAAREADPQAILFLNDYRLESHPERRRTFLRLAEALLKDGVPLGGLGTQSHIDLNRDPAMIAPALRDLASLGLPIHVSEADMGLHNGRLARLPEPEQLQVQARMFGALAEAFHALPERQRFAFSTWGARDKDSWIRRPWTQGHHPRSNPLLFDDDGLPKPAFDAVVAAWR